MAAYRTGTNVHVCSMPGDTAICQVVRDYLCRLRCPLNFLYRVVLYNRGDT